MDHVMGWILQTVIFAGVLLTICFAVARVERDAMALCQIEHSYDTCFQALNR